MTHFSDELIQDILVDKDNNYFTKIIEDVSKYLDKHKTVLDVGCGNGLFIQSFFLKKLSAVVSPTGQEAVVPVQVYSCGNCGKVPTMFLEGTGLGDLPEKPKEDSLSRPDLMG